MTLHPRDPRPRQSIQNAAHYSPCKSAVRDAPYMHVLSVFLPMVFNGQSRRENMIPAMIVLRVNEALFPAVTYLCSLSHVRKEGGSLGGRGKAAKHSKRQRYPMEEQCENMVLWGMELVRYSFNLIKLLSPGQHHRRYGSGQDFR